MKKTIRYICVILALSVFLAIPAQAQTAAEPRGSIFFASYGTDLEKTSSRYFRIWFDVTANAATMDVLGVSEIVVYRSADGQSWSEMKTFTVENYPWMVDYNTGSHTGYVTYNSATPGYYYRAYVFFYAQDSRGIGVRDVFTEILQM